MLVDTNLAHPLAGSKDLVFSTIEIMSSDPTKSELFNLNVLDLPDQTELVINRQHVMFVLT